MARPPRRHETKRDDVVKYKQFNEFDYWQSLPEIPRNHEFKTIPLDVLDSLGWRWVEEKNSYYIPYFDRSETVVPFSQLRHLVGERRFTFLKDARPIVYGMQNLDPSNSPLFIVEGASDAAVLHYVAVPWIAMPSASSGALMQSLAKYCDQQGIELVYAGDNDEAGDKLREALEEVTSYRVKQPPKKYKDWGDFLVAEGFERVHDYCAEELGWEPIGEAKLELPPPADEKTDVEKVLEVFPGATQLEITQ